MAMNADGVFIADINLDCRWIMVKMLKRKRPQLRMHHHYCEVSQMLESFLRFSKVL